LYQRKSEQEANLKQLDEIAQSWIEKILYRQGFIVTPKSLQALAKCS
jgi:hypothetical protein